MSTWDDVRVAIRSNLDKPMTIELERDGQPVTVQAKPMVLDLPVYDDQGRPEADDRQGRHRTNASSARPAPLRSCRSRPPPCTA